MNVNKIIASLASLMLVLSPMQVYAEDTVYATDNNGNNYASIESAWSAANNGTAITLQTDWNLGSRLVLNEGATATVELNGHKISRDLSESQSNGEVLCVNANATLTLTGLNSSDTEFTLTGSEYTYSDWTGLSSADKDFTYKAGGLITGGKSTNGGGGIHVKKNSTLNLNNVIVGGNRAEDSWRNCGEGGGICADGDNTTLNLTNAYVVCNFADIDGGGIYSNSENSKMNIVNSHIDRNSACGSSYTRERNGGGIYVNQNATEVSLVNTEVTNNTAKNNGGGIYIDDEDVKITLDGSHVNSNAVYLAEGGGGGIFVNDTNSTIEMKNSSTINENFAYQHGGGIYFNYSYFTLKALDDTENAISNNEADEHGAGIYICSNIKNTNSGEISGITMDSNYSTYFKEYYDDNSLSSKSRGGAIYVDQENITIKNCTLTHNSAMEGSAIYVNNDDCVLEDCTITDNNSNNHLGAVTIDNMCDITLNGKMIIKKNQELTTKYWGIYCDLVVKEGDYVDSYIKGNLSKDASVGLYLDKARTIVKEQASDTISRFYSDTSNYYLEYDSGDQSISSVASSSSSIFGDGNTIIAGCVMGGIVAIGIVALVINKKKNSMN